MLKRYTGDTFAGVRRDGPRADRIVELCKSGGMFPIDPASAEAFERRLRRSLEDWPEGQLPPAGSPSELEHYRELVAISTQGKEYDKRTLILAGRCHGSDDYRKLLDRYYNDPLGGELPTGDPETDEGFASVERLGDELKAWFLSGSSPIPFAYFDPLLHYVVGGITKAAASIGETPLGLLSSLTMQLASLAAGGSAYDAGSLVAAWSLNPNDLDLVEPVGQELPGGPSIPELLGPPVQRPSVDPDEDESGNVEAREAGMVPSRSNTEIVERINAVMKDPASIYKRVSEASDEELVQTAYFGRMILSELGDTFKIQWPDDEYLDVLGALLGPMICVMFSDPDKPITSRIPQSLLPTWARSAPDQDDETQT
jgi:hypothetical protein